MTLRGLSLALWLLATLHRDSHQREELRHVADEIARADGALR